MTVAHSQRNGFPRDPRAAAETYLLKGLAPIWLPHRAKDPGYSGWPQMRLRLADLDKVFPSDERRNIGVLNGAPSNNHIDVDLDTAEARAVAPLLLPPTGWIFGRASSPRSHWIYRADASLNTAQESFHDSDGKTMLVELRGSGGLTIFPPSTHRETGETVAWDRFDEPGEVALADLQRAVREVAAAALLARHWPHKGGRDAAAMALTGGLVRGGWDEEKVSRFVEATALAAGDEEARSRAGKAIPTARKLADGDKATGWPALAKLVGEDVVRTARGWLLPQSATPTKLSAKKPQPRSLAPYVPFPVEDLPEPLHAYVHEASLALGCDPAYIALPVIATAASMIGNSRVIRLKSDWIEPCVFWTLVVADSGTLKSPAHLKAVSRVFRIQKRLIDQFKLDKAAYDEALALHKKQTEEGGLPEPAPEQPILQRTVCSDTTIEGLAEILEDNHRGVLVARDELAGWMGSFTRYKGRSGGTDLPNWLEMFRAGTLIIDRKTSRRPTLFIQQAAVCVCGGIQPGILSRILTPEFLDAGLVARLLMAMPITKPKVWSDSEISPDVARSYEDMLDRLLALEFDTSEDGSRAPVALKLSAEARKIWVAFYNSWAKEQAKVEGELAAAFSKLEAYAARFALLHHVITCLWLDTDDRREIGRKSVEAGIHLARWFGNEARRVYATLSETAEERETRRLVEWIRQRGGSTTARLLQKSNSRKYPSTTHAENALDALVGAGIAEWIDHPTTAKGGRPTRELKLLPTPGETDTTHDDGDDDDDPPVNTPSDTTSGTTQENQQKTEVLGGCVGIAACRTDKQEANLPPIPTEGLCRTPESVPGGSVGRPEETKAAHAATSKPFELVRDASGLAMVCQALGESVLVGLDLETTGLDPRTDRIRLLSLSVATIDGGRFCYLVDCFEVDPTPLWDVLAEQALVIHNGAFDLGFLAQLGFVPGVVHDTMLLSQLLSAGTHLRHRLRDCTERELGHQLSKEEQKSDWSGTLTEGQLVYAALDAEVLVPLYQALRKKIAEAKLDQVAALEARCLPALVWAGSKGVAFDRAAWRALADQAADLARKLSAELDAAAPIDPDALFTRFNWDSPDQVKKCLALVDHSVDATDDTTLAGIDHPIARLLRDYREATKKCSTYGTDWLKHVAEDSRVYPSWKQLGASSSGRMSCSEPNMQQLPRGDAYRRCVVAPPGRVLVKADYSQIELRIAAKITGDKALLEAYQRGEDLHTRTARSVLGLQEVTKKDRQLAKALNFGLLYGMGAPRFRDYAKTQYGVELTEDEAKRYRNAFFAAYPGLRAWHSRQGNNPVDTRTLAGRRRLAVNRFSEKLNTPVQGTGADGLKQALALLWERRDQCPGAFPVLVVHDEIVLEADADKAASAAAWLKQAMLDGMTPLCAPVPVEVEVKIGITWGGN